VHEMQDTRGASPSLARDREEDLQRTSQREAPVDVLGWKSRGSPCEIPMPGAWER
jgi:hypothetical protein